MFELHDPHLLPVAEMVRAGQRLSFEEGVTLFRSRDLLGVGYLANIVQDRMNGNRTYFICNRHVNYTNICINRCRFCAFGKEAGAPGAYTMDIEEVLARAAQPLETRVREFHIVGGAHPELPFSYYLEMLRSLRDRFPDVHLQAFTAVEIGHMADRAGLSVSEVLRQLQEAGLGSLPGGGAEVFSPRVRGELCPEKMSGTRWLEVMRAAHRQGIRSNATMLYGHVETIEERIDHLLKLRELQDETGGFQSFIPLAFHPQNTRLAHLPGPTGQDDLKMLAVSRLLLDNFSHIKAFWIMLGMKVAQLSLFFGVDDLDGTVVEEKITHAAGARTAERVARDELVRLIREAGRIPGEESTAWTWCWIHPPGSPSCCGRRSSIWE